MNLDQARAEISEQRTAQTAEFRLTDVAGLAVTIHHLCMLRNKPMPGMDPESLAQRRMLLDVVLRIVRNEMKVKLSALVRATEEWEKFGSCTDE